VIQTNQLLYAVMGTDCQEDPAPSCASPLAAQRNRMAPMNPSAAKDSFQVHLDCPEVHAGTSGAEIDLDAWRLDLRMLHGSIDQAVKSFIASQTKQLDLVATELSAEMERMTMKERCFRELGDSIASFVEAETAKCGVHLPSTEMDARAEAYDAELPGPPALHRINRQWRKMTRAFEAIKEAKNAESSKALEDMLKSTSEEKVHLELKVSEVEQKCEDLQQAHAAEVEALRLRVDSAKEDEQEKESKAEEMATQLAAAAERHAAVEAEVQELTERLDKAAAAHNRAQYEWEAEREEMIRNRSGASVDVDSYKKAIQVAEQREADLLRQIAEKGDQLGQMKSIMDEQERTMTTKIDRVQQYVKEKQAVALAAEKKQQDADRMCERWQREVHKLQAEKDRLATTVLSLETEKNGQTKHLQGAQETHQQELSELQASLRKKEDEMRAANMELLEKRDAEYQNKINLDRQREKDRSIALLNKKQQELQIKDAQLTSARQRIRELEAATGMNAPSQSPSSRPSSAGRRQSGSDASLPKLPQSAR